MVLAKPIGNGLLELLRLLKKFHRIAFTDDAREKRVVVSPTGLFDTVAGSADGYRGERAGRVVGHAEPAVGR